MSVFPPLTIKIYSDMDDSPRERLRQRNYRSGLAMARYAKIVTNRPTPSLTLSFKCMAQFWIAIFFILLAIAQLYQSIKNIDLPLPVYLVLGTALAIASNARQQFSFAPLQKVTLQEIRTPDPIIDSGATNILTPTEDRQ